MWKDEGNIMKQILRVLGALMAFGVWSAQAQQVPESSEADKAAELA